MIRKISIVLLGLAVSVLPSWAQKKDIYLKIPARVATESGWVENLEKKDFSLTVNGDNQEISECFKKKRDLGQARERATFCLAFNLTDYSESIARGIAYFVDQLLIPGDRLFVWSPVKKIYRINLDGDKQRVIGDIEKIVKGDSLVYKQYLDSMKQNLATLISNLDRGGLDATSIKYFVNNYQREFTNFKNRFLIPDLTGYSGLLGLMGQFPGEKWLINFQEREIIPTIKKYRVVRDHIRDYLSSMTAGEDGSWVSSISSGLNTIDKTMLLSDSFPTEDIQDLFLGINLGYNVMFLQSMRKAAQEDVCEFSPDYENILRHIARSTGGVTINTTDIVDGLKTIAATHDSYYELVFLFDDEKEEKAIKVAVDLPKAQVFHRTKFNADEIKAIVEVASQPTIKVADVSLAGHVLGFSVSGQQLKADQKPGQPGLGAVKIEIKLVNDGNIVEFQTAKTITTDKPVFSIKLNLPGKFSGYYKLSIGAEDLVSGRFFESETYVKIE